jgi:hypothetical protein
MKNKTSTLGGVMPRVKCPRYAAGNVSGVCIRSPQVLGVGNALERGAGYRKIGTMLGLQNYMSPSIAPAE